MMRSLVGWSITFRGLVVAIAAAVAFLGVVKLRDAPVDILPEFTPPTVEIQAEALGLSAVEVEQLITVPFEQDLLNGIAFLDEIRSESLPGLARIELVFEPGTDLFQARQVVQERLAESLVALPGVSKPPQMLQPLSSTNRALMIGVSSSRLSPIELSVLARWVIKPRLLGVPGVANVATWGQRERQLQVQVDPQELQLAGVSLLQVVETAGNALWVSPLSFVEASVPGTGGFFDTANQRLGIRHISPIAGPDDLAQVRVEETAYRLGDVARIVEDHQPLIGDAVGPDLLLIVEKFPDASALDVTRGVEEALDALRPGLAGVEFDTAVYRPAGFIESAIDNLALALVIGAAVVALLLWTFLVDWRVAAISIAAAALSLVVAGLVLSLSGATVNSMVLAGVLAALVLVIDDATVDAGNIARRLRESGERDGGAPLAATVLEASVATRRPLVYATLIVALAFVPVFFLDGLAGAFLPDMAASYLLAVASSLLVAATVTPALAALLLSRAPLERRESRVVGALERAYERLLTRVLARPGAVYAGAGALLAAGAAVAPFLGHSLLPTFKEPQVLVRWSAPPGTSLPEMSRLTSLAAAELDALPGVTKVDAHVGRAVTSDQPVDVDSAELWATIASSADYDATAAAIADVAEGYPGVDAELSTYSNERATQVLQGAEDDVVVRIYGEDLGVLRAKAEEVRRALTTVDGLVDEEVAALVEEPTVEVRVDLAAAQAAGIKPGDVRRASATLLSGLQVGSLFEEQKVFDVVVWGVPEIRRSLSDVRDLVIDTPGGGSVHLGEVADVRIAPGPNVIRHESVSRYLDVGADVVGRSLGAAEADVEQRLQGIQFPLEYHAELVRAGDGLSSALIAAIAVAVAIGLFLLLQAAFDSWRLALLTCLVLPLPLAGGVLAAFAAGSAISLGSLLGLFAVGGISARTCITLVDRYRRLEREEGEAFGSALVLRGSRERVAPVVLTTLATIAAVLPLVVRGSVPGYEVLVPAAIVILGGVATSALVALLVLPPVYLRFAQSPAAGLLQRLRERAAADRQVVPRP